MLYNRMTGHSRPICGGPGGGAFASAQAPADAAAAVVEAAVTGRPKFRWQTSDAAAAFVGLSLANLDGSRVLGQTSTWVA